MRNAWFDGMNSPSPLALNVVRTASFDCSTFSAASWFLRICSGDVPSCAIMMPMMKLLSPTGRNDFGTAVKR